mmetsp:Transcript_3861/g.15324  ORF Transcript_3861/g.15324 Transcript_3861/m.15324 type:complete len:355 (-) Transcript_3861:1512-2576(-)
MVVAKSPRSTTTTTRLMLLRRSSSQSGRLGQRRDGRARPVDRVELSVGEGRGEDLVQAHLHRRALRLARARRERALGVRLDARRHALRVLLVLLGGCQAGARRRAPREDRRVPGLGGAVQQAVAVLRRDAFRVLDRGRVRRRVRRGPRGRNADAALFELIDALLNRVLRRRIARVVVLVLLLLRQRRARRPRVGRLRVLLSRILRGGAPHRGPRMLLLLLRAMLLVRVHHAGPGAPRGGPRSCRCVGVVAGHAAVAPRGGARRPGVLRVVRALLVVLVRSGRRRLVGPALRFDHARRRPVRVLGRHYFGGPRLRGDAPLYARCLRRLRGGFRSMGGPSPWCDRNDLPARRTAHD